jgi:hypothetical protein
MNGFPGLSAHVFHVAFWAEPPIARAKAAQKRQRHRALTVAARFKTCLVSRMMGKFLICSPICGWYEGRIRIRNRLSALSQNLQSKRWETNISESFLVLFQMCTLSRWSERGSNLLKTSPFCDKFTQLTGYPKEEILGGNCRLLQRKHTDLTPIDAVRNGSTLDLELLNYQKDS